jgi:Flp pilus assembly protein TadB
LFLTDLVSSVVASAFWITAISVIVAVVFGLTIFFVGLLVWRCRQRQQTTFTQLHNEEIDHDDAALNSLELEDIRELE